MTVYTEDSTCAVPENWGSNLSVAEVVGELVISAMNRDDYVIPCRGLTDSGKPCIKLLIRDVETDELVSEVKVYED